VIFARGNALFRVTPDGKGETEVATLAQKAVVRALRTDAAGAILLADIGGTWAWMPLDGSTKTLTDLPCGDGPRTAHRGRLVRAVQVARKTASNTITFNFKVAKAFPLDVPAYAGRIVGEDKHRKLIWADRSGVWSAPLGDTRKPTQLAPEAPLRGFLPGARRHARVRRLRRRGLSPTRTTRSPPTCCSRSRSNGAGARRKSIKDGVPVEWSHECAVDARAGRRERVASSRRAAASTSAGRASRPHRCRPTASTRSCSATAIPVPRSLRRRARRSRAAEAEARRRAADEPEQSTIGGADEDVAVALPTGPLALYRGKLESGPYTAAPVAIVKIVDGAAVWVPGAPK